MNKFLFCLFVLTSIMSGVFVFSQNETRDYVLVFSDEFNQPNGSKPDDSKWICPPRGNSTWSRWVSDNKGVTFIKNGKLICRAIPNKKNSADTATMLTGALCTKGKFDFKYGKVEVRMKSNLKRGNFPAVWMVPVPSKDNRYGEIDIVESFGDRGDVQQTVHTHQTVVLKKKGVKNVFRHNISVNKWHVYGVEWTSDRLIFTIDGHKTGEYRKSIIEKDIDEGQWTFDRLFYILLNQSVGNGENEYMIRNKTKIYETRFDWIHVWQKQ